MTTRTDNSFSKARRLFEVTHKKSGKIYLNSASTGPLSIPVLEALNHYYSRARYDDAQIDNDAFSKLDNIRNMGAKLLTARRDEIGFGFNTGFGLNIAACGLPLKKGDEVLLSDNEFPSNVYPWTALEQRGIKVKFTKSSDRMFNIDNFEKAITRRSKVLSLSYVQFFNGYKNDLMRIGNICRERGLYFVVDGIQGCGVEPINVKKCQIDILSSGAQKWMLSPLGTGLFYIRKDLQKKLTRPFAGWLSVDWKMDFSNLFHYDLLFYDSARSFELGTYPYGHIFGMSAALELILSLGAKNIQKHNHELLDKLISYLKSDKRFRIVSSLESKHRSSILAFTCDNAKELFDFLVYKERIICSYREGAIRISVHLFNNKADISHLIRALKRFKD